MISCIICPIYEKERDFNYALEFYQSKIQYGIKEDIYYIFSYETHKEHFEEKFKKMFPEEILLSLVIPDNLNQYKSPVTVKKLFGVFNLYEKYDYIAVVDCECLFIRSANVTEVLYTIWKKQSFLVCNKSYLLHDILKTTVYMLGLENNQELKRDTDNYLLNCWFSDIPVYCSENVKDFHQWLYSRPNLDDLFNERKITDYYLYILYLYLEKGYRFRTLNYWSPWGIMEDVSFTHPKSCNSIEKEIGTHWSSNPTSNNEDAIILFHRDHQVSIEQFKKILRESKLKYIGRRYAPFLIKVKNWLKI